MFRSLLTLSLILMLATMVIACSSGGGPIAPDGQVNAGMTSQLPVYTHPSPEGTIAGTGALGVFQVSINTETMSYDLVPLRMSSFVASEFEVDLTLALTSSFCKDCVVIRGIGLNSSGNITLDVGVKHPFKQVTSLPAPRPERPDLHIFDVQGIVVVEGSQSFPRSGITLNPNFVVNADGYTTAFDAAIDSLGAPYATSANAHPFKILSMGDYQNAGDDIGNYDAFSLNGYPNPAGILNPTGFNVLKCGSPYKYTQYELHTTSTSAQFFFVVTASYGQSAKGLGNVLQRRDSPVYLMPMFSKPEAWNVRAEVENNNLADNDNSSAAEVVIRIADWQDAYGATTINPNFDPAIDQAVPRNTLTMKSDVKLVQIDIPSLNSPMDDSALVIPSGQATFIEPKTYRITVNNDTFASTIPDPNNPPQFWGLVSVKDDLEGTANPAGGIDRDLLIPDSFFGISDYTTYQVFGISVFPPNDPPVPVITVVDPPVDPPAINSGQTVDVDGSASFDTDGAIIKYEWDFDYDPISGIFAPPTDPHYFTDPDVNIAANPGPVKLNNLYPEDRSKYIALRVTDNSVGQTKSSTYVEILVHANQAPTADLGIAFYDTLLPSPYTFYQDEKVTLLPGPLTWDDGIITTYQYDFSYDGSLFIVDQANTSGAPVMTDPQMMGSPAMAVRVIDNGIPNLNNVNSKTIEVLGTAVNVPVLVSAGGASGVDVTSAGYHAIAAGDGVILAAWTQDGVMADIFFSRSTDNGTTWSPAAKLNTTTNGSQQFPSLAVDPLTDTFYCVFKSNSTGQTQIAYAISDPGGATWQASNQGTILPAAGTGPDDPSVAVGSGSIYVAYQTTNGGNKDIVVRVSSDNGLTWNAAPIPVNTVSTNDRTDPCIALDGTTGNVAVAWDDFRNGTAYQIYFNMSNSSGTAFGTDVQVAPTATGQNDPSVVCYNGLWAMIYDDLSATTDIFFTSSNDGVTWSVPVDTTDNADSVHNNSSLAVDSLGIFYVSTRDTRETDQASMSDVYVFKSTDSGATWVRGVRANDRSGTENAYPPNIVGLRGSGGFVVLYESPDNAVYCAKNNAY